MTHNLWSSNSPALFWQCRPEIPEDQWRLVIQKALPILGLSSLPDDVDQLLELVLGERQFGSTHWQLSRLRRTYYLIKPALPRQLTLILRQLQSPIALENFPLSWPIEDRYARFQWEIMRQLLLTSGQSSLANKSFWPFGNSFAFVLTHDIETKKGQAFVRAVADLDESFGFRSSFNFVPDLYSVDYELIDELRERGFEIGLHGLKHDGNLFNSYTEFMRQAQLINAHLKELDAVGFRSPLTLRNPEWMQGLEIEYDLSFFDTDPYEPIPGGTMSIWPFFIGHFAELPYTLIQDYTLTSILCERSPRIWLEKVDFIQKYLGMVLLNTHPDYLSNPLTWNIYNDFLSAIKQRDGYWHALPKDIARWWRARSDDTTDLFPASVDMGKVQLTPDGITVSCSGV